MATNRWICFLSQFPDGGASTACTVTAFSPRSSPWDNRGLRRHCLAVVFSATRVNMWKECCV